MSLSVMIVGRRNICRSPLAEAVLRHGAAYLGLEIEVASAGVSLGSVGDPVEEDIRRLAFRQGIDLGAHRARQLRLQDFRRFDHILGVDRDSVAVLAAMKPPGATAATGPLLVRAGMAVDIHDPLPGDAADFARTVADVNAAVANVLQRQRLAARARPAADAAAASAVAWANEHRRLAPIFG